MTVSTNAADIQQSYGKMVNGENARPLKLCGSGKNAAEDEGSAGEQASNDGARNAEGFEPADQGAMAVPRGMKDKQQ